MSTALPISEIMTTDVVYAHTGHTLTQIQKCFTEFDFHHLPVVDSGELVGIISSSDVMQFYAKNAKEFLSQGISDLDKEFSVYTEMTKKPVTVSPETPVSKVAEIIAEGGFHAIPILKEGQLVGIVTSNDIIKFVAQAYA